MAEEHKELRDVIREMLHEGVIDLSEQQTINKDGLEVRVTPQGEGCARFDLPRLEKAYQMMSGRMYERPYAPIDEPVKQQNNHQADTILEDASLFAEHLSYTGTVEKVDTRKFKNKIVCECGNLRWVKNSDMFQVVKCKPCTYKARKNRRTKSKA